MEILHQPQLLIFENSNPATQVLQIFSQLKSVSFCWLAMEELEQQVGKIDQDLLYFQEGQQLFFCSKSMNKLIAKIHFQY